MTRRRAALVVAVLSLVAMPTLFVAAAGGTPTTSNFSGSYTAPDCGPDHHFDVPLNAGIKSIQVTASTVVAANDIVLHLFRNGSEVASEDFVTSPETITYTPDGDAGGGYDVRVCPFTENQFTSPADYTGTFTASDVLLPAEPASGEAKPGSSVTPSYTNGSLVFAPTTQIDLQRTEGEPLNFFDSKGVYWESGPWGTHTQQSFVHRSTDDGLEFHVVGTGTGLRPDNPPGGGDTDIVVDDQGFAYFVDLEALANLGTSVSNDDGKSWRKNPTAIGGAGFDRQWYAVDNGISSSADDNTIFLAFRNTPQVGVRVYSSPGSKGPDDPIGGLIWQDASASAPLPIADDRQCGQLIFEPVRRNLYYPCNVGGTRVRMSVAHVAPGQRTGIVFRNVLLPPSPGGSIGGLLVSSAVDSAGNVYAAWVDQKAGDNNVYYTSSSDGGSTWNAVTKVSTGDAKTNRFPWIAGAGPGNVVVGWYGQGSGISSDSMTSWYADPNGADDYPWYGYVATITNANTATPTIAQERFTDRPMHFGEICTSGTLCTADPTADRTMADYMSLRFDRSGKLRIVYNDTTNQHHGAALVETRQIGGPNLLRGGTVADPTPSNPMADEVGDAQWPHYGLGSPGSNQPQLDFTNLRLRQPNADTLRIEMTLSDLSSLQPPPGKTSAFWITRFQARAPGNSGEDSYRIFYVGAEKTEGLAPSFFAGSTVCVTTTPQNCKVVEYPPLVSANGQIVGNKIQITVPLAGGFGTDLLGHPFVLARDARLYSVTAFSGGRQDPAADVYADVDATHAFDYLLGSEVKPDLTPTKLELSSTKIVGGDNVTITATVENIGNADASNVAVRFTDNGAQIDGIQTIGSIAAGGKATASVTWNTKFLKDDHTITVTVDPGNTIAELDETNNSASGVATVHGNKVKNFSFESSANGSSPDNWSSSGSTTYANGGSDGNRSVTADPLGAWTSDAIAVTPGHTYGVAVDATGAGGSIVVQQLSALGTVVTSVTVPLLATPMGVFKTATGSLTVVDGVTQVRVKLLGAVTGSAGFDNVRLWEE
jgi:CARDB